MNTPWTNKVDTALPLPEYPRPQLARRGWVNLNGQWNYAITNSPRPPKEFDGQITVPFSPETKLSGVERTLHSGEYLWYRRVFDAPADFLGKRVILHFGAVDQSATVWVNGVEVIRHNGGYLPFEVDITDEIDEDGFMLITVRVTDDTDESWHTRGKQKTKRGGIWYTPQSGIWQTVWMEAVPESYVKRLIITPDYDNAVVEIAAEVEGREKAYAFFNGKYYRLPTRVPVPDFIPWTPECPKLYGFTVVCGADKVQSYFAMRKFSVEEDEDGNKRLFLNNKPYFHNGLLDQGYWPDGLYTAPTDEALCYDIRAAKALGFNTLRKHIKVEPLRWYYHCDRLGMLVWQDMPSGGTKYNPAVVTAPVVLNVSLDDHKYKLFGRDDRPGRREFIRELSEMVEHLYNCPCVAMWVPFNEGWGQFDAARAYDMITTIDDTRPVDHASGWHDQKVGEVTSKHVYFRKYKFKPDKYGRAMMLSEFGGFAHRIGSHSFSDKNFGYKQLDTPSHLEFEIEDLYQQEIRPAIEQGLAAAIYTQLTDVEDELNGFFTYDRRVCKIAPATVRKICNLK